MMSTMHIVVETADDTVLHDEYRKFVPRPERLVCRLFDRVVAEMLRKYPDAKYVEVIRS